MLKGPSKSLKASSEVEITGITVSFNSERSTVSIKKGSVSMPSPEGLINSGS